MIEEYLSTKNIVFNYDKKTGEFLYASKAPLDPLESKLRGYEIYGRPAFSTFVEPPKTKNNEKSVFKDGSWKVKPDFRGKTFYTKNGSKVIISDIGISIPDNAVLVEPPSNLINPKYVNGRWIESGLLYHNIIVKSKEDVDNITSKLIKECGEEKAKTEKLIAGDNPCTIWETFVENRSKLIQEANNFIVKNKLK